MSKTKLLKEHFKMEIAKCTVLDAKEGHKRSLMSKTLLCRAYIKEEIALYEIYDFIKGSIEGNEHFQFYLLRVLDLKDTTS